MNGSEILEHAEDYKTKPINIPEWGGNFIVREMSGECRELFEEASRGDGDYVKQIRGIIAAWCLYHPDGTPVWKDPRKAIHALSRKPFRILSKISEIAVGLSAASLEDLEDAERK